MTDEFIQPLLAWYDENKRILPWRDKNNAYYTWVSEIMLQQTRVEAVKPYFARFIQELPDIPTLAACPQEKLLKLWEGLGYYSRVRNMQLAAQEMVEKYNGKLPEDFSLLLSLKGIGSYTAGAIASIAYGMPQLPKDTDEFIKLKMVMSKCFSCLEYLRDEDFSVREEKNGTFYWRP